MAVDKFPVEAGQIMLFARALADDNPAYHGGEEKVLAPPTFVQSSAQYDPDYPLRPRIGEPWFGSGKTPTGRVPKSGDGGGGGGASAGVLHAEQHYVYHRPLQAGETLTASYRQGKSWEKVGRRAGKLVFNEVIIEFRNEAGELVVTARSVGVRTERVIES